MMLDARQLSLVIPGVAMIALAFWTRRANARAAKWPSTCGRVLKSKLVNGYGPYPDAQIQYTYDVDGANYCCANVSHTARAGSKNQGLIEKYRVGAEVTVYYDPVVPSQAVLENGPSHGWLTFVVGGLLFIGVGVFLV
jgi:hypothetical protein